MTEPDSNAEQISVCLLISEGGRGRRSGNQLREHFSATSPAQISQRCPNLLRVCGQENPNKIKLFPPHPPPQHFCPTSSFIIYNLRLGEFYNKHETNIEHFGIG